MRPLSRFWVLGLSPFVLLVLLPVLGLFITSLPFEPWIYLNHDVVQKAVLLTLKTSLIATLIAWGIGVPVAYILARFHFPGKKSLEIVIDLPTTMPPVVIGLGLLLIFGQFGWLGQFLNIFGLRIPLTTTAVVIALVFRATPLLIRASRAGFESIPILYEQAASSGGMNEWQCFRKIMIPMARPAWMAGITLAFTLCLAEFGATLMFAGNIPGVSQTLPVAVMSAMESDLPLAICIAVVSMSLSILSLAGLRYVEQRWRS